MSPSSQRLLTLRSGNGTDGGAISSVLGTVIDKETNVPDTGTGNGLPAKGHLMSMSRSGVPPDATDGDNVIQQHWTLSRRSVVLSGPRERLRELADQLDVPADQIIDMTTTRAVLALWGAPLEAYQQRERTTTHLNGARS